MSNPNGPFPDDAYWRRPAAGPPPPDARPDQQDGDRPSGTQPASSGTGAQWYAGPPRMDRPPAGWRTPVVVEPAAPRPMPPQDHERLDAEEQAARTVTYGVGMITGAVLLLLLFVVCVRGLF